MIAYLDSSALLKLFLGDEQGAAEALFAWSIAAGAITSRITYVEARSGLAAARRSGRLTPETHEDAVRTLDRTWLEVDVMELDDGLARRAGDVAEAYGLGAGDAVQLASALEACPETVMLVTWDRRLRTAAIAAGLAVHPPEV